LAAEEPPAECPYVGNKLQDLGCWIQGKLILQGFFKFRHCLFKSNVEERNQNLSLHI